MVQGDWDCDSCSPSPCTACYVPAWLGHTKCHEHLKMNRGGVSCDDKNPCHVCRENFEKDDTGSHKKRIIQLRKDRKAKREKRKSSVTPLKRTPWEESDDDILKGT